MNPEGMNSLNHYAYGSVVEWMYRYVAGIRPLPEAPGFREALLAPLPDYRMSHVKCRLASPAGTYESSWAIEGENLKFRFVVPFGAKPGSCCRMPSAPTSPVIVKFLSKKPGRKGTRW